MSGRSLAIRLIIGVASAAVSLLAFYFIPANLPSLISGILPVSFRSVAEGLISSLISPSLPPTGLILSVIIFLGALFRGSKLYGPLLILIGVTFISYIFLLFQGGSMAVDLPAGLIGSASGGVTVELTPVMILLMLAPILTMVKGATVTFYKIRERP